jgi:hypothetical protein
MLTVGMTAAKTMDTFRLGHTLFRKLNMPITIYSDSIRAGIDLPSESGDFHVDNVRRARTPGGRLVLLAPDGASIAHVEHGSLSLPNGTYRVDTVRDARPQEIRTRTQQIADDLTSALARQDLD